MINHQMWNAVICNGVKGIINCISGIVCEYRWYCFPKTLQLYGVCVCVCCECMTVQDAHAEDGARHGYLPLIALLFVAQRQNLSLTCTVTEQRALRINLPQPEPTQSWDAMHARLSFDTSSGDPNSVPSACGESNAAVNPLPTLHDIFKILIVIFFHCSYLCGQYLHGKTPIGHF